jgi:predicted regulator of Ras-like GTPase activity (Roadblock/LC7/MglB family)
MFREVLGRIVDSLKDVYGVFVMDSDGLSVEKVVLGDEYILETLAVECANYMKNAQIMLSNPQLGGADELFISASRMQILVKMLSSDYYMILFLKPGASLGQARYELSKAKLDLAREF